MNTFVAMPLVAMWCVTYCGFHPAPSSPTPSDGHVTGDMKRRESNQTLLHTVCDQKLEVGSRLSVRCVIMGCHHNAMNLITAFNFGHTCVMNAISTQARTVGSQVCAVGLH